MTGVESRSHERRPVNGDDVHRAYILLEAFESLVVHNETGTLAGQLLTAHESYRSTLRSSTGHRPVGDELVAIELQRAYMVLEALTHQIVGLGDGTVSVTESYAPRSCVVPSCPGLAPLNLCLHHELLGRDD